MKNLIDYLPKEFSWWTLDFSGLKQINETRPTKENLRIIFYCRSCHENVLCGKGTFHVAKLEELKVDKANDFNICCPYGEKENYEVWLHPKDVPSELKEIFDSTTFEKK